MIERGKKLIYFFDNVFCDMKEKQKLYLILGISVVVFLIMWKLNSMTPSIKDDFLYCFIYLTDNKINTLDDVFISQYNHYMQWGGRAVAHTLLQILLSFVSPDFFDVVNTLVFLSLIFLIYLHAKGDNKNHNVAVFISIPLLIWFFTPNFSESILWTTGSLNYLWTMVFILFFLLPYRLYSNKSKSLTKDILMSVLMLISGFLAGCTNENMGIAVIIMVVLWFFYYKVQKKWSIPIWMYIGLIGAIIGFVFMVAAPGNYIRSEAMNRPELNLFGIYYKFNVFTYRFFHNLGMLNSLLVAVFVLVMIFSNINKKWFITNVLIYFAGIFIATYSMILSPSFPARAWFGIICLNILVFAFIVFNLNYKEIVNRFIIYAWVILGLVAFPFTFYLAYKDIKYINEQTKLKHEIISRAKFNGEKSVVLFLTMSSTKYSLGDDSIYSGLFWSKYYDIEVSMKD